MATTGSVPTQPAGLVATGRDGDVFLQWTLNLTATRWELRRRTGGTDDWGPWTQFAVGLTGERIAALEGIDEAAGEAKERAGGADRTADRQPAPGRVPGSVTKRDGPASPTREHEMPAPERGRGRDIDLAL